MPTFENFPYTNFHEMNQDWIISKVKELEQQVDDFKALLETGPITDVRTLENGVRVSIKNGSGIADIPAASDTTAGAVTLDNTSDDVLRISGAETFEVPILDNGMIAQEQLPVQPLEPATSANFGGVKVGATTNYLNVTDATATYQVPRMNSGEVASSVLPTANATRYGAVILNSDPGVTGVTRIVGQSATDVAKVENGKILADVIPDSGVTNNTYGTVSTYNSYAMIPTFTVGADGRITNAFQSAIAYLKTLTTTITAGNGTANVYCNSSAKPSTTTDVYYEVFGFTPVLVNGVTRYRKLVEGVDYTTDFHPDTNNIRILLTEVMTTTAYFRIYGNFGLASK